MLIALALCFHALPYVSVPIKDLFSHNIQGDGSDCHGHGTHCAGTTVGTTYGLAKQGHVHSVRVMSCSGSGSYSNIIAGE